MIICMAAATIGFAVFAYLFLTADENIFGAMVTCRKETEAEQIKKTQLELERLTAKMKKSGLQDDKTLKKRLKTLQQNLQQSQKKLENLQKEKVGLQEIVSIAGYRMMQMLHWDGGNDTVKKLYHQCIQFKERREAMNYTYYILSSLMGNVALGFVCFFTVLGLCLAMGLGVRAFLFAVIVLILFFLGGYVPYDNVNTVVKKRKEEIENQFPQVVSKLTLLTVAGMEVNQAWKLTAGSAEGVLYQEMDRVLVELNNNVPPAEAYGRFITRCDNAYTTKLATAIIQNAFKGNAEIVVLFRRLNSESWLEHKHNARRRGEQISSKLLVPTLLMFVGIIIMVIVPVMTGFSF